MKFETLISENNVCNVLLIGYYLLFIGNSLYIGLNSERII